jgi:hypothetical protein
MVRLTVLVAGLLAIAVHVRGGDATVLPALSLQDQESRRLALPDLRGRVVIIVYGTRERVNAHIAWGRRLEQALISHGAYRATDALEQRPVTILALAQMGGIPSTFRPIVRAVVRQHTPADFSLWLDWDDRMSVLFGADPTRSSVVVADRAGRVRLITTGSASDAAVARVVEVVLGLL